MTDRGTTTWLDASGSDDVAWSEIIGIAWTNARLAARYIAATAAAGVIAVATGVLLDWTGFLDQNLGSGGLGTFTTTDLTMVLVAFAAGAAGMLAFET